MLMKSIWLLAFISGVSAAGLSTGDIQGELSQAIEVQAQQPLFYGEPPHYPNDKCSCTTIYKLLSNDSRFDMFDMLASFYQIHELNITCA